MVGPKGQQQTNAVLDGTVDQFKHLRDEFLHARCAQMSVEQLVVLPALVDDERAGGRV